MDEKELKREIARILDRLPRDFRSRLDNVAFVIEKRPKKNQLQALGLDARHHTLYGLYQGTPLPERSVVHPPLLPDKITIFSEPLLRNFSDPTERREQLRLTLLHEIAHYFGMEEAEIEGLGY